MSALVSRKFAAAGVTGVSRGSEHSRRDNPRDVPCNTPDIEERVPDGECMNKHINYKFKRCKLPQQERAIN